jgi:sterol desaturase/sphingolipid hydroxylase (fatty acid hydroxylase superfamily)
MTEALIHITKENALYWSILDILIGFLIIFISVFLYIKFKKRFQKEFDYERSSLEEAGLAFAGYNMAGFFVGFVSLGIVVYLIGAGFLAIALNYSPGVEFILVLSPFFLFLIILKLIAQKMEGKHISDLWKGAPN